MAENDSKIPLGPRQRRIRHIRSIAGRNIVWNDLTTNQDNSENKNSKPMSRSESATMLSLAAVEDSSLMKRAYQKSKRQEKEQLSTLGLLDAYFTLHVADPDAPIFYKSEMIPNTINPTFRALPFPFDWMNWYAAAGSLVITRLWVRHSIPDSAGQHTEPVLGYQDTEDHHGFQLLIEWQLDLNALSKVGNSISDLQCSFRENTLLFELDDGFYSTPDVKATKAVNQNKRLSMLDLDQKDAASIHSVNSSKGSKTKRSYTYNNMLKINTMTDCIYDTQRSSEEVRLSIQQVLEQEDHGLRLRRELNQHRCALVEIEAQIMQQKKRIQAKKELVRAKQQQLEKRRIALGDCNDRCLSNSEDLQENQIVLEKNISMRQNMHHTLSRRKKELIADLFSIYPIEQCACVCVDIKRKKSYDDSRQFSIRGIHLPNSVYDGQNEEMIATALGYTAHLVSMLAYYLEIPLRYPTIPMGSRAYIRDLVSVISGSRDFPLYSKGVDRYRFEFGVFLLNKNIEQLMNAYGLIVIDLRHTLPNIHYFIQAILTTSVTSGPTSMSVLSISSYANGSRNNNNEENGIRQHHNHLTLQPKPSIQPPSPSISNHSVSQSSKLNSPKLHSSAAFLNTPQAMAAPTILDPITTSSSRHDLVLSSP
ncbi:UV radiation resistance protein and autophagy-related subunit 14-domain-containing protein [Choanephora cucurbitarum]|nr:UV radiation resistance protein and autophagy-related subunit 14-domain-containing protein [Choanephora cucurbitarum]